MGAEAANVLKEATGRAYDQLARRARTYREMVLYLQRKEYEQDIIDTVMANLEERGFIDDTAYAIDFTTLRLKHKPEGRRAMVRSLMKRGIEQGLISTVLDDIYADVDETALAQRILEKRGRRPASDTEKEKRRIASYLERRGISSAIIYSILNGEME